VKPGALGLLARFAFEKPTGERIRVARAGAETGGELAQLVEVRTVREGALLFGQLAGVGFRPRLAASARGALAFLLAPTARLLGYWSFDPEATRSFLRASDQAILL
jgi:hypothetical protein